MPPFVNNSEQIKSVIENLLVSVTKRVHNVWHEEDCLRKDVVPYDHVEKF